MIELKNVTKEFDGKIAVDNISLKINKGEILGFLGPNGAGKTTTMRVITGFLVPDKGEVLIEGENMYNNPVKYKSLIGYMPENNPLYKDMLVKDSLNFIMDLHKIEKSKRKEKLDEVVKSTGIQSVYYKPISELSKGYKQRVGIAQVLIQDPEILILDEPTEGLDPNQRVEIRDLIKRMGKERTVIISTHVMQEVEVMCDRIVIIKDGKIISDGSKETILKGTQKGTVINIKLSSEKGNITEKDFAELKAEKIVINKDDSNNYSVVIYTSEEKAFERLTKMIKRKDWVVYELNRKTQNLEDIFRELTNEKTNI